MLPKKPNYCLDTTAILFWETFAKEIRGLWGEKKDISKKITIMKIIVKQDVYIEQKKVTAEGE